MAITSEFIGSLNTPGYVFRTTSPGTFALPKFPNGATIMTIRWSGSGTTSYDLIYRDTGVVAKTITTTSYGTVNDSTAEGFHEVITQGALLRVNNSTDVYFSIVPNIRKTPPVWNG